MESVTIIGLVASPRKGMNTDCLVSRALEGAQAAGATTSKVYLNDLKVTPCQACAQPPKDSICIYKDGMETIYHIMETTDGLILGSPAYYGTITSQLKLVVDRSNCQTEFVKYSDGRFTFKTKVKKHKKAAFIWVAGSSLDPTHALQEVKGMLQDGNAELIDTLVVRDADQGDGARNRSDELQRAFALGQSLVQSLLRDYESNRPHATQLY